MQNLPMLVDSWNDELFTCRPVNLRCGFRVGIGALLYPGIVGLLLAVPVGIDAFLTQPQRPYLTVGD